PEISTPANQVTAGGELEKVTVTGYLVPRVGGGPQPVFTMDRDFISKQSNQTINDVLNRYPGGMSQQNAMTFVGQSTSPASSAFAHYRPVIPSCWSTGIVSLAIQFRLIRSKTSLTLTRYPWQQSIALKF